MKLILLLTFSLLLFQCGKKQDELIPKASLLIEVGGLPIADDNVSVWDTKPVDITYYYTSVDTVSSPEFFSWKVSAICDEGDSVRFAWAGPGLPAGYQAQKDWYQTYQKWGAVSTIQLSTTNLPSPLQLSATTTFLKAGKIVTRTANLVLNKQSFTFDLYRVNFGMSREEVKKNEVARLGATNTGGGWYEHSPALAELNLATSYGNNTYYQFDTNQLKAISVTSSTTGVDRNIEAYSRKLKSPVAIPVGPLTKDYTWNNGKLKFTVSNKEFALATGTKKYVCLTYEKL